MRLATALAAVVLVLALGAGAAADIPSFLSYQGVLNDDTGTPVPAGTYSVVFRLYDQATGGTALWEETQSVSVIGGIMNVHLGTLVSLTGLDFLDPYWLGISVEGEAELSPRTAFATVPYAGHAGFADTCLEGDSDWDVDGDDIHHGVGNVGIGVEATHARFDVGTATGMAAHFSNAAAGDTFTIRGQNARGTVAAFYSCTDPGSLPDVNTAIYARGACGARGGHFYASSASAIRAESWGVDPALSVESLGEAYSAEFTGGPGIRVHGTTETDYFAMATGAAAGLVLTSDGGGSGTWQAPSSGSDGDWLVSADDMSSVPTGNVGIGDATPDGKLHVAATGAAEGFIVEHGGAPGRVVRMERTSTPDNNNDILEIRVPSDAPDDFSFIECERGPIEFAVLGDGDIVSNGGASLSGDLVVTGAQTSLASDVGPVLEVTANSATIPRLISSEAADAGGTMDGYAVYGKYIQSTDFGIGGKFEGGYIGVWGVADEPAGSLEHYGVRARATGGGTYNYGIYASASTATAYAGYFEGNVNVTGTLTADTKMFLIDHPLDPANKYLAHACVESDEMKNVYDGVVVLDGRGEARVELPDWFEAVNGEYRYQLTCVGGYAPVYIAEEIANGSFAIAGGTPGLKVSWQVTGVRHDPYSLANRAEVVQDKPPLEVGTYRHPELYGMPETSGVMYREERGAVIDPSPAARPERVQDPNDGE